MKQDWKRTVLGLCLLGILLSGCGKPTQMQETMAPQTETAPQEEPQLYDVTVMENREGELVFSGSMEEFIDCYNSLYERDHDRTYLTPAAQWYCSTASAAIHSEHETWIYTFTEDENVHSLPRITVYVPTNGTYIQEITVDFDEHSYSDTSYALYEQMCRYTLGVFFPDLEDAQLGALWEEVVRAGNINVFSSEEWYDSGCMPCALYYRDGIGVYPYFAIGDWMRFCIIPVTQETISAFEEKGVEIHEID